MARALRSFTLIELLLVVLILAILALIAIPNLREAQTRSRTARVKADHGSLRTALEAYAVEHNAYPPGNTWGVAAARPSVPNDHPVLERLSTPLPYLTQGNLPDLFVATHRSDWRINGRDPIHCDVAAWTPTPQGDHPDAFLYRTYLYFSSCPSSAPADRSGHVRVVGGDGAAARAWCLYSAGPMRAYINMGGVIAVATRAYSFDLLYDPTNGTVSFGNIYKVGGETGPGDNFFGALAGGN